MKDENKDKLTENNGKSKIKNTLYGWKQKWACR